MENENYNQKAEIFSKKVKAGKRRTYFFDVRNTKSNDFFLTITESTKSFENDTFERHKIFIYKEDFNKFAEALLETVDYIKSSLLPEYNFDQFAHKDWDGQQEENSNHSEEISEPKENKQNDENANDLKW